VRKRKRDKRKKTSFQFIVSSFQLIVTRYKLQDNLVSWLTGYPVSQLRKSKNKDKEKSTCINWAIGELLHWRISNWLIYLYLNLNWSIGQSANW